VYDAETELLETKFQTLDLIFPNRICKGKKPKPTTQPPEKANSTSILSSDSRPFRETHPYPVFLCSVSSSSHMSHECMMLMHRGSYTSSITSSPARLPDQA
jgi:hypothetical protein